MEIVSCDLQAKLWNSEFPKTFTSLTLEQLFLGVSWKVCKSYTLTT